MNTVQSDRRKYVFRVDGIPAPQGSKRHVGGGRMVEMSKRIKPWRDAVRVAAEDAMNGALPIGGPVEVQVTFDFERPKTVKRDFHVVPPDVDKLLRGVLDGLTNGGVFDDDKQVIHVTGIKRYADVSGADITITEVAA